MIDPIVTMEHVRQLGYCARGARSFFERYSLDYTKFLSEGIPASELLAASNDDWMVQKVVEVANGQG